LIIIYGDPKIKKDKSKQHSYTYYRLTRSYRVGTKTRQIVVLNLGKLEGVAKTYHKLLANRRIEALGTGLDSVLFPLELPDSVEDFVQSFFQQISREKVFGVTKGNSISKSLETNYQTVDLDSLDQLESKEIGREWLVKQAFDALGISSLLAGIGLDKIPMKTITTTLLGILVQLSVFAQCDQNVSSFGNSIDQDYSITGGDAVLTLNTNNSITLDLASDFDTAQGPDVRAYLINSQNLSNAELATDGILNQVESIEFGIVGNTMIPISGAKSFTIAIPSGVHIENYDKVLFYCIAFNAFWDFGSFESFSSSNCSLLSTTTFTANELAIYPNPVREKLNIELKQLEEVSLHMYTINGQLIRAFSNNSATNFQIDMSDFNSGLYLLEIESNNRIGHTRLLVN